MKKISTTEDAEDTEALMGGVRTFRSAVSGRPEGLHYFLCLSRLR